MADEGVPSPDAVPAETPAAAAEQPGTSRSRRGREPKKQQSVGRRITFWGGVAMLSVGLSLLGYVGWELWGTNWLSWRTQRQITSQLEENWNAGQGCDSYCPNGDADALIRIPRFGSDYVVPVLEGAPDGDISEDVLAKGFGHFANTAAAGALGNYAIAGHRVTHGEPLRDMPDLRPGDKVIVETRLHTYTYELDTNPNNLIIDFTGVWVLNKFPKNPNAGVTPMIKPDAPDPYCQASRTVHCAGGGKPGDVKNMYQHLITLTTCSEIFHTDNRMIAFGHLIEVRDKEVLSKSPTGAAAKS
jgi:sortase A